MISRALGMTFFVLAGFLAGCGSSDTSWEDSKEPAPDKRAEYSAYSEAGRYGPGGDSKAGPSGAHKGGGGGGPRAAHGR